MSNKFDIYIEEARKLKRLYGDFNELIRRICSFIKKYIDDAEIYLFGSMTQGKYTMASDIDLLIITRRKYELDVDRIKALIKREFIEIPLEIHIVTPREFRDWYMRFIKEDKLLKIL